MSPSGAPAGGPDRAPQPEPVVLVTYVDRCPTCSCSSLRDDAGPRPLPGVSSCGASCRCHAPLHSTRAVHAALTADAARLRFWRRSRGAGTGVAAVR